MEDNSHIEITAPESPEERQAQTHAVESAGKHALMAAADVLVTQG